ncbi:Uncharacterised protein [Bordetella pertussis]|nr:Uncharacterised protein [Bordetella pertussis]CFL84208.1 Uncharacterised protein [Bordetella pertussis]CFM92704.1 Uncharacterised protein [Bordetella pertussis]CFN13138.1 Uncharacterised protein [Bordetella pertussis]CFN56099.1 Uncharacterised protein [Bordetella pertussis]
MRHTSAGATRLTGRTRQVASSRDGPPATRSKRCTSTWTRHTGVPEAGLITCTSGAPNSRVKVSDKAARNSSGSGALQRSEYSGATVPSPVRTINCGWSACAGTLTGRISIMNGAAATPA